MNQPEGEKIEFLLLDVSEGWDRRKEKGGRERACQFPMPTRLWCVCASHMEISEISLFGIGRSRSLSTSTSFKSKSTVFSHHPCERKYQSISRSNCDTISKSKMTSSDVRDMLDLPGSAPRPAKKQKLAAPKSTLKGLAREVQSLGGDNPIAIVPEVSVFKKRRFANRKPVARWEFKPFKNSARKDGLILRHWRRAVEAPRPAVEEGPEEGGSAQVENRPDVELEDSVFAKFNVQVEVPKYDDVQYAAKLDNPEWSRHETDYLMAMAEEYDLRWPIIWDRYEYVPPAPETTPEAGAIIQAPKVRSMEDLKKRYYTIAATMMAIEKPVEHMTTPEFKLHEKMRLYDPVNETARKKFAEANFHRTKEEAMEEESLLIELKRIISRADRLSHERAELYARLDAPASSANIGNYTSSVGLAGLIQQLVTVDKSKNKKRLTGLGLDAGSPVAGPSSSMNGNSSYNESRSRESISGPSGSVSGAASNNKKGGSLSGPSERRKLSDDEIKYYGVSYHDRLQGGPFFRMEKILKNIVNKSQVQQGKIGNMLEELGIPKNRLHMPTADTGLAFETLLGNIGVLLDMRKVADKVTADIAVERERRAERERVKKLKEERSGGGGSGDTSGAADGEAETQGEREKSVARSVRSVASGAGGNIGGGTHKRSASVMSAVSDKSAKRQKK